MSEFGSLTGDPEDWGDLQSVLHRAVDDMVEFLQHIRQENAWDPVPEDLKEKLKFPLSAEPKNYDELYQTFLKEIKPYHGGNIHPRFWGWVNGTGLPSGLLSSFLTATLNINNGGRDHIGLYLERQVLSTLKQIFPLPAESSGVLTGGCSEANLIGLTAARYAMSDSDIRIHGIKEQSKQMVFYCSDQAHSSITKAIELLGIGRKFIRYIKSLPDFSMDVSALKNQILKDRNTGLKPVCVIANIGTVNTGAFDDLGEISQLCKEEGIWLHIDAAFGMMSSLVPKYESYTNLIREADSVAFDLHKWFYMQYDVGCVFIKDELTHLKSFSSRPDYLRGDVRGMMGGGHWFTEYGIQLSRSFRALKVWFALQEIGVERFQSLIEKNIEEANHMGQLIKNSHKLELLAPVSLNIICFRYLPAIKLDIDGFNRELLFRIHEEGNFIISSTNLRGNFSLRMAITNHRTLVSDIDYAFKEILRIGELVEGSLVSDKD